MRVLTIILGHTGVSFLNIYLFLIHRVRGPETVTRSVRRAEMDHTVPSPYIPYLSNMYQI